MKPPLIDIRAYDPDDYDACRALCVELAEHHRIIYDSPGIGGDDPGSWWDRRLESPRRVGAWVAIEGGAVIGVAGLETMDDDEIEVEPIIVSNEVRGRGIGRLLMERLMSECRDLGYRSLSVRSVARNFGAFAAWRKMGFTRVGLVELFVDLGGIASESQPGVVIDGIPFDT